LLIGLFPATAYAQTTQGGAAQSGQTAGGIGAKSASWPDGGAYIACMKDARTNNGSCGEAYTYSQTSLIPLALTEKILGCVEGLTCTAGQGKQNLMYNQEMNERSAVGKINTYIASMYTVPPANTMAAIQDFGQSLGFIPKNTYAQGIGFNGLSPLLPIWKAFRNIAYALLAALMIVIGFMVMLRKKIDPKTVVTVQNALPRIVLTLFLITFSYAIVGFMIDLMYVAILAMFAIFKSAGLLPPLAGIFNATTPLGGSLGGLVGIDTPEKLYTQGGLLQNITNFNFDSMKLLFGQATTLGTGALVIGATILGVLGLVGGNVLAVGLLGLSVPLVAFLIAVAQLLLMIKLFILFLGAYVKIIISLITAPFHILFEVIPGSTAFSDWFKNLIVNIVAFPIGALMFMLAAVFIKLSDGTGTIWSPPYASFLNNNIASVGSWVALGLLFAIPSVVAQVQEVLKAKPLVGAGPEAIGGVFAQPIGLVWQGFNFFYSRRQHQEMMTVLGKRLDEPHKPTGKP
jgi:hypothetical protein